MESFVLHEDHVSNLKTTDKVLNGGSKVTTTGPNILNKCDIIRADAKGLGEPTIVELDTLVLEEMPIVLLVENLNSKHDEA